MTDTTTGKAILLETLAAEGVTHVFGNPGTTELPLMDGLADYPDIRYILCLHEAVAVSMADAFAHASGEVGVVNLHVGPGLGNGLGSVYNAYKGNTPLLVTAGQQDARMLLREPLLSHDLVAMAAPLTKWSVEPRSADELPLLLHRAFKTAREAPSGPVFVSLPMDVMDARTAARPMAPSRLYTRNPPDPEGLEAAVSMLLGADRPAIVCGDEVARAGAGVALATVAERIGAPVHTEVLPARANFPTTHPHYRDRMAQDHRAMRERLAGSDLVLLVGGKFFEEIWFEEGSPFPDGAAVVHLERSGMQLARHHRVDCGLQADVRLALEAVATVLETRADDTFRTAAAARAAELQRQDAERRSRQAARAARGGGNRPMSAARLMDELAGCLPEGVSVAGEAITGGLDLIRSLAFEEPSDFLDSRGGGIGQGLPSGIGVKLALPERPVLCVSGDGSAMYTIQGLWTAAHHDIPVVFLILNNGSYRILRANLDRYRERAGIDPERGYAHLDLDEPPIDFLAVARGLGVEGRRVEAPEDVEPALRAAFDSGRPYLLDVAIDRG
jgi:benzoylformate decarboxylase